MITKILMSPWVWRISYLNPSLDTLAPRSLLTIYIFAAPQPNINRVMVTAKWGITAGHPGYLNPLNSLQSILGFKWKRYRKVLNVLPFSIFQQAWSTDTRKTSSGSWTNSSMSLLPTDLSRWYPKLRYYRNSWSPSFRKMVSKLLCQKFRPVCVLPRTTGISVHNGSTFSDVMHCEKRESFSYNRGDITSLAQTFSISRKKAAWILQCLKDGTTDELYSSKRKALKESEWPELIKAFYLTNAICREPPPRGILNNRHQGILPCQRILPVCQRILLAAEKTTLNCARVYTLKCEANRADEAV